MRMLGQSLLVASLLVLVARAAGAVSCTSPADLAAVADVRALVAAQCDCASALDSRTYVRCAQAVAQVAITQGRLAKACLAVVRRCASKSTCGRSGAVACCQTTASGRKKCAIKRDASLCRAPKGGSACVSAATSCCDACDPSGGCAVTTTTTLAPTPTTTVPPPTTTTTLPGPVCGNGVREAGEACDCGVDGCDDGDDFGGVTCPGTSAGGAFLDCVDGCTRVDTSGCPGATTTTLVVPATTTSTTSTTVSTTTTTSTTLPPVECTDPILRLPPLLNVPLETVGGSSSCGGPGFAPAATSPFVGSVRDASGRTLASLGTNCLYAGGGGAAVPGISIPTGTQTVVSVVGLRGARAIFGPSDGDGPASCTRGAGPGRHCLNGQPGRDGQGRCTTDADCGGAPGSCALDANCYFAPPLTVADVLPGVSACVVSTALADFCGDINILGFETNVRGALSNRIYLQACPTCTSGRCSGGPRNGERCTPSGAGTSVDCLPAGGTFLGAFAANVTLSSERTTLASPTGIFCPGQTVPGAFGLSAARRIETDGTRPNLLTLRATIAGPFCVAPSGNPLVDAALGLPAPAAVGARARISLLDVLRLFGR
jgi:hypothetical protein